MIQALIGFFTALPQLLTMIQNGWAALVKLSGGDVAGYINNLGQAFSQLSQAKTQEEHANAAKAIADAISNMPAK